MLEWENVDGDTVRFTTSNDPGASGSLGPVSVTLAEENANTLVSRVNVTITNSDVSLVCTNDANSAIAALNLMSKLCSNPLVAQLFAKTLTRSKLSVSCASL